MIFNISRELFSKGHIIQNILNCFCIYQQGYLQQANMECKYIRQSTCMSFAFHPKTISLFSLVHFKNRLRIIQQNLYTGLIMNDFPIPLREETLEVDNYTLCYNEKLDLIIFTLSNHILIYSIEKKILLVVAQANIKSTPLYITKTVTRGNNLYFSATEQKMIYGINLQQCIQNAGITNYLRYKVNNQSQIQQISINDKVLVALCTDSVLRIWDLQTTNTLKGVAIQNVGRPVSMSFSKNDSYLLIGTSDGYVQVFDGQNLGLRNTMLMSQKIAKTKIQSLCWFHYSGESQSLRFLAFSEDGNIKLFSFWFEKKEESYQGRSTQLSLLYINRHQILQSFMIKSHPFANFLFFSPGILLYMVDTHSLIYYPIILKQNSVNFDELCPNNKKEVYFPRDIMFMKGLQIKRIKDTIQDKLSLQNQLEYKQLKILRLDIRPKTSLFAPEYTKILVTYYLSNSIRAISLSKLNLNTKNENLSAYKQYNGSNIIFLGQKEFYEPFILILQQDKQTITVLSEGLVHKRDLQLASQEERKYFQLGPGELYTKKITIKVQKLYPTPFRFHYVVLYQSDNLLRFSNNINYQNQLLNYDVYPGLSLRMDYNDIILDVIWTHGGQIGAVLCLDKVVFINADLKLMRNVPISGYVVQGQWIGYTLIIATKKDVQYLDILSKPHQAYCIESLQSKYLIVQVLCDRVIGIEKTIDGAINIKVRYFKIMQPLVSGYLNYQKLLDVEINKEKIKHIIECFSPYFNVNEEFIELLNSRGLSSISKYFIQGNQKMYSKPLRAKTLNSNLKIERFIDPQVWNTNKKTLLDLFLSYQQSKDSNDPYQVQKGKQYAKSIQNMIGKIAFDSIKDLSATENANGITINNNFGSQSLYQLYYDFSKEGHLIKMEIYPFKAENCGEWLGQFGMYLQAKQYYDDESVNQPVNANQGINNTTMNISQSEDIHENPQSSGQQDEENQFKNLILYFRCDDGKGETVQDLSDYGNNGTIEGEDNWITLYEQPMQLEDNWGKKCPPQFSLSVQITVSKKLNMKKLKKLTVQIWVKPLEQYFDLLKIGNQIQIKFKNLTPVIEVGGQALKLQQKSSENELSIHQWSHLTFIFNIKSKVVIFLINCVQKYQTKEAEFTLPRIISNLRIGDPNRNIEYTEIRFWRKVMDLEEMKNNMRTPLELVAEKRKRLKMKLKEKKKKQSTQEGFGLNPFSLN